MFSFLFNIFSGLKSLGDKLIIFGYRDGLKSGP